MALSSIKKNNSQMNFPPNQKKVLVSLLPPPPSTIKNSSSKPKKCKKSTLQNKSDNNKRKDNWILKETNLRTQSSDSPVYSLTPAKASKADNVVLLIPVKPVIPSVVIPPTSTISNPCFNVDITNPCTVPISANENFQNIPVNVLNTEGSPVKKTIGKESNQIHSFFSTDINSYPVSPIPNVHLQENTNILKTVGIPESSNILSPGLALTQDMSSSFHNSEMLRSIENESIETAQITREQRSQFLEINASNSCGISSNTNCVEKSSNDIEIPSISDVSFESEVILNELEKIISSIIDDIPSEPFDELNSLVSSTENCFPQNILDDKCFESAFETPDIMEEIDLELHDLTAENIDYSQKSIEKVPTGTTKNFPNNDADIELLNINVEDYFGPYSSLIISSGDHLCLSSNDADNFDIAKKTRKTGQLETGLMTMFSDNESEEMDNIYDSEIFSILSSELDQCFPDDQLTLKVDHSGNVTHDTDEQTNMLESIDKDVSHPSALFSLSTLSEINVENYIENPGKIRDQNVCKDLLNSGLLNIENQSCIPFSSIISDKNMVSDTSAENSAPVSKVQILQSENYESTTTRNYNNVTNNLLIPLCKYFKGNKCELCGFVSQSSDVHKAKHHLFIHLKDKNFKCDICGRRYSSTSAYFRHCQTAHLNGVPFESKFFCNVCGKPFINRKWFRYHQKSHTFAPKRYPCRFCNEEYGTTSALKEHSRIHLVKLPYTCTICNRGFRTSDLLFTHTLKHNAEKLYACEFCEKKYNQKELLDQHMKIHKDSPAFKCDKCEKAFNFRSNLKQHMLVHLNFRRHDCKICGMKFKYPRHLTNHVKWHH